MYLQYTHTNFITVSVETSNYSFSPECQLQLGIMRLYCFDSKLELKLYCKPLGYSIRSQRWTLTFEAIYSENLEVQNNKNKTDQ